eukprot:scaffold24896_cov32-Tisochrysis_lutea.AAC.1
MQMQMGRTLLFKRRRLGEPVVRCVPSILVACPGCGEKPPNIQLHGWDTATRDQGVAHMTALRNP